MRAVVWPHLSIPPGINITVDHDRCIRNFENEFCLLFVEECVCIILLLEMTVGYFSLNINSDHICKNKMQREICTVPCFSVKEFIDAKYCFFYFLCIKTWDLQILKKSGSVKTQTYASVQVQSCAMWAWKIHSKNAELLLRVNYQ